MNRSYNVVEKAFAYFQFWLKSKNRHGVHSPFVYRFVEEVLNQPYKDSAIEGERAILLKDKRNIQLIDLGADQDRLTSVARIAIKSLKKPKEAQLLAKMVRYFKTEHVIEFGTSLGISTAYMARANEKISIQSIEGSEAVLDIAKKVWDNLGIRSIKPIHSSFDAYLPHISFQKNTLYYIDGNHTFDATMRYFNFIGSRAIEGSLIIFDDIHWSKGMLKAWNAIVADPRISLSIDLFELGIVFLGSRIEKEHFILRY